MRSTPEGASQCLQCKSSYHHSNTVRVKISLPPATTNVTTRNARVSACIAGLATSNTEWPRFSSYGINKISGGQLPAHIFAIFLPIRQGTQGDEYGQSGNELLGWSRMKTRHHKAKPPNKLSCGEFCRLCTWEGVVLCPYDGQQRIKTDLRFVTKETGESPLQAGMVNLTGTPSARALLYQLYENIRTPSTQAPGLPPTTDSQILRTLRHYNYRISQRFEICTLERAETSTNHFSRRSSRRSRTDNPPESGYCA